MTPHWADESVTVFHGDCIEVMVELPDASVDAVVTDPPYGLEFMGKEWDAPWKAEGPHWRAASLLPGSHSTNPTPRPQGFGTAGVPFQLWCEQWATECLRVLKPGGHMLAFGGTRTWHRLACAVEDAGFEVRDSLAWVYAQGFPKSLNVSKALDDERCRCQMGQSTHDGDEWRPQAWRGWPVCSRCGKPEVPSGLGTALKPAHEPIVVARKPLSGTVAANVLAHGTGALNIDACRIGTDTSRGDRYNGKPPSKTTGIAHVGINDEPWEAAAGRWPANVILDESQAAALDEQSGTLTSGSRKVGSHELMGYHGAEAAPMPAITGDSGGASRFFKVIQEDSCNHDHANTAANHSSQPSAPADSARNDSVPGVPLDVLAERFKYVAKADTNQRPRTDNTAHPTVKPLDLMRWLVRLITPPGGTVLDPFAGSGTTAEACIIEGFRCVTIEREPDYLPLITQRLTKPIEPVMF